MRYRVLHSVRKRQVNGLAPQDGSELCSLAGEAQAGTPTGLANDLHVLPGHSVAKSGTDCLHRRLFGGKASGQAFGSVGLGGSVADLFLGKDSTQKAIAKTLHGGLDPCHFGDVNSSAYNHLPDW